MTESRFFHLVECGVNEVSFGAYSEMCEGRLDGLLIRDVVRSETASQVVGLLESRDCPIERFRMGSQFPGHCFGLGLDRCQGDLAHYLESAQRTLETMRSQDVIRSVAVSLQRTLHQVVGERATRVPQGAGDQSYLPYNFRCFPEGGFIPPHIEMEQKGRPSYQHLNGLVDERILISFFLTLQPSDHGGALNLFDLTWGELRPEHFDGGHTRLDALLGGRKTLSVKPRVGDLLVFNGGRFAHEVSTVSGTKNRWTMGGFLAPSLDHSQVFLWT